MAITVVAPQNPSYSNQLPLVVLAPSTSCPDVTGGGRTKPPIKRTPVFPPPAAFILGSSELAVVFVALLFEMKLLTIDVVRKERGGQGERIGAYVYGKQSSVLISEMGRSAFERLERRILPVWDSQSPSCTGKEGEL